MTSRERLAYHVATVCGLGDRLPAPGTTAGSLPTTCVWALILVTVPVDDWVLVIGVIALVASTIAGLWASEIERQRRGAEDPGPVVIDEVAGQLVCYLLAVPWLPAAGLERLAFAIAGFFLFRAFDIVKLWPANRLEGLHGGLGIMADDLAAGVYAGLCLIVVARFLPDLAELAIKV